MIMLCCTAHKMFHLCSTKCPICSIMLNQSIATIWCQYTSKGRQTDLGLVEQQVCFRTLPCWATDMFLLITRFLVRSDLYGPQMVKKQYLWWYHSRSWDSAPVPLDSLSDTESIPTSLTISGNTLELEVVSDTRLIAAMAVHVLGLIAVVTAPRGVQMTTPTLFSCYVRLCSHYAQQLIMLDLILLVVVLQQSNHNMCINNDTQYNY